MAASTTLSTVATVTNFSKLSTCHMQGVTETTAVSDSDTPLLVYCRNIGHPVGLLVILSTCSFGSGYLLQGPQLVIITTEQGQRSNSETLRGIICTVCCCTGLINPCFWWECSDRICSDHVVLQLVPVSNSSYKEWALVLVSFAAQLESSTAKPRVFSVFRDWRCHNPVPLSKGAWLVNFLP